MTMAHLVLFFLACGAATFPLTLMAVRYAASLSPASALSQRIGRGFETALSLSFVIWIVGALVFYAVALVERRSRATTSTPTSSPCLAGSCWAPRTGEDRLN